MADGPARHSRRSACDRCRVYKLRCVRLDNRPGQACERCTIAHLDCTTTLDTTSHLQLQSHQGRQPSASIEQATGTGSGSGSNPEGGASINARRNPCNGTIRQRDINGSQQPDIAVHTGPGQQHRQQHRHWHQNQHHNGQNQFQNELQQQSETPSGHQNPAITPLVPTPPPEQGQRSAQSLRASVPGAQPNCEGHRDTHQVDGLGRQGGISDVGHAPEHDGNSAVAALETQSQMVDEIDFDMGDVEFGVEDISILTPTMVPTFRILGEKRRLDVDENPRPLNFEDLFQIDGPAWPAAAASQQALPDWPDPMMTGGSEGGGTVPQSQCGDASSTGELHAAKNLLFMAELSKLSLELIEEHKTMETKAPLKQTHHHEASLCSATAQHASINRILRRIECYWKIIKGLSSVTSELPDGQGNFQPQSRHGNYQDPSVVPSSGTSTGNSAASSVDIHCFPAPSGVSLPRTRPLPGPRDHLLAINVVTTYIQLIRSCQAVFVRLLHAFSTQAPTAAAADARSMISLPSLQFGEFQLEGSPRIQIKVLIELTLGMLARVWCLLGIEPAAGMGNTASSPNQDRALRLALFEDPAAMSIREVILSQERVNGGEQQLLATINSLKETLERT